MEEDDYPLKDVFEEIVPDGKGMLCVLDSSGDTKLTWDSENADETLAAKEMFKGLKKKGFAAFSVKGNRDQNQKITDFDPELEKIIMVPPIAGG